MTFTFQKWRRYRDSLKRDQQKPDHQTETNKKGTEKVIGEEDNEQKET